MKDRNYWPGIPDPDGANFDEQPPVVSEEDLDRAVARESRKAGKEKR